MFRSDSEPRDERIAEEAYRVLRSNVSVALSDLERPSVIVTSSFAGEGKTSICVNLARSLAQAGQRVVVVDLDLRKPDVHRSFGLSNERGVTDVLLGNKALDACLRYTEVGWGPAHIPRGLYVLSAGPVVDNPAELLGAGRAQHLLTALTAQADVLLIDTPPVLAVADALTVGRMVAGAILVVEAHRTPIAAVQSAKSALIRNQTRLLGVALNKLRPRADSEATYQGYGYGYGYADNGEPSPAAPPNSSW